MKERQELYCHDCQNYVQFDIDLELNGNHVLTCPVCGHEHCRVVEDGVITDIRWDTRNKNFYAVSGNSVTWSTNSSFTIMTYNNSSSTNSYSDADVRLMQSWFNSFA